MDLAGLQAQAREKLDPLVYDYYSGGADEESTLSDNVAAWQRYRLRPRVLRDVSAVDISTTVLGTKVSMPVLVAPTGYHMLADPDGEKATSRGTAAAGTLMTVSTLATVSLEEVAAAAPGSPRWFQLYIHTDRQLSESVVRRAVAAGYQALVLTVDLPVVGNRRKDDDRNFTLPDGMTMANFEQDVPSVDGSGLSAFADSSLDPSLTFSAIGWLKDLSGLPVLVKGVLRDDDAAAAVEAGAAGIIVSNHGGRQLDTAVATADALSEIVDGVGDRCEVFVDGGIRLGTDVVKALAKGAKAVLVGRPVLWGLATGGAEGVEAVLAGFAEEVERAMTLCGARSVDEIDRSLLA